MSTFLVQKVKCWVVLHSLKIDPGYRPDIEANSCRSGELQSSATNSWRVRILAEIWTLDIAYTGSLYLMQFYRKDLF